MTGKERIKTLAADVKDKALLQIIDYLLSRDDMDEKYLNESKSLKGMIDYIRSEAQKLASNNMAVVKDEIVYGWAIHYFDEDNKDLGIKESSIDNEDNEEIIETKPIKQKEVVSEGQLTLF